jgi:small subunit ribosomal protein S3Ae
MAGQKRTEKATKVTKKSWYSIIAPKIFRNVVLGETLLSDPKLALNKTVTQNLMNLVHDVKKQNINIKFIVDKVEGGRAYTSVIGYSMIPASIKRLTRRRSEKIELSFVCETSDNKKIRLKPLVFTKAVVKGSVKTKLYKTIVEYLTRAVKKMTFDNLVSDIVNYKLQTSAATYLKKIYPLRKFEIKSMELEKGKKDMAAVKKTQKVEEKERKKGAEKEAKPTEKKEEASEVKEKGAGIEQIKGEAKEAAEETNKVR